MRQICYITLKASDFNRVALQLFSQGVTPVDILADFVERIGVLLDLLLVARARLGDQAAHFSYAAHEFSLNRFL